MQSAAVIGNGVCQRGRCPDGRKRRWTRAQKTAAKRVRAEEWSSVLSMARQWKLEREIAEGKSTTPTRGGVGKMGNGKWVEELPWELWELIFDDLSAVDRLSCVTSTKAMMEKYGEGSELAALWEEARDEAQTAQEECYAQRIKAAVDYYIMYNIELRQPAVSYKYVARRFRIGKPDLREEVEARRRGDEDSDM